MGERNGTRILRVQDDSIIGDHDQINDIGEDKHHPRGEFFSILINSQSVPATSIYAHRVSIEPGHQVIRAILRGANSTDIQGHDGVVAMGTDAQQESMGVSIKPYGAGGYPTSYMGCYSRLHGDSYISYPSQFGTAIILRDIYIDTGTDEAVLVFYNSSVIARNMSCYGQVQLK